MPTQVENLCHLPWSLLPATFTFFFAVPYNLRPIPYSLFSEPPRLTRGLGEDSVLQVRHGLLEALVHAHQRVLVLDADDPVVAVVLVQVRTELERFIDGSRGLASGWVGFYWGKTIEEYRGSKELSDAITAGWLEFFRRKADAIKPQ
jgi:hypothetical protein